MRGKHVPEDGIEMHSASEEVQPLTAIPAIAQSNYKPSFEGEEEVLSKVTRSILNC